MLERLVARERVRESECARVTKLLQVEKVKPLQRRQHQIEIARVQGACQRRDPRVADGVLVEAEVLEV